MQITGEGTGLVRIPGLFYVNLVNIAYFFHGSLYSVNDTSVYDAVEMGDDI